MKKIPLKLKPTLNVAGNGLWSSSNKTISISKMEVHYWTDYWVDINDAPKWGELRVFFHKKIWDVSKLGLIYTDTLFLKELKIHLKKLKIEGYVDYSEQGMQGNNYVSLDVDRQFINCWMKNKFKTVKKIY
jgi:hypothetical protein